MFPYNYVNRFVAALFHWSVGDTAARVQHIPDQVATFWNTNRFVMSGVSWAQTIAAVVSAIATYIIVVVSLKKKSLRPAVVVGAHDALTAAVTHATPVGALHERWNEIMGHLDSARESDWKIAVMEADKLVDDALAKAGFPGDTFGDRLTNIQPGALRALDGVWWAHKIRNRLAHELDYFLRYTEARQAIGYYGQALDELQLI